jgi:hypothetical protein
MAELQNTRNSNHWDERIGPFSSAVLLLSKLQTSIGFNKDQHLCSQNRSNDLLNPVEMVGT